MSYQEIIQILPDGFTDGFSWVCGYLGDSGTRLWQKGGRAEALAMFARFRVTVPGVVWPVGMCSRVDVGTRVWDRPAHRWRQIVADTVNDVSYGRRGGFTGADDALEIAAETAPDNRLCLGPFPEDLCFNFPPVDLRVVDVSSFRGPGWFMLCMKSPVDTPLFQPSAGVPYIQGVTLDTMQDGSSRIIITGKSAATQDGFPKAVVVSQAAQIVAMLAVPPWQDGTGNFDLDHGGVETETNYPLPDGYEIAAIVHLSADQTPNTYGAVLSRKGPAVQQTGPDSIRVRTFYRDFDGTGLYADDWIVTNGAALTTVQRGGFEPSAPTALQFFDLTAPRTVSMETIKGLPPTVETVWRHRLRAFWHPGDGDRQRVFVIIDVAEYLGREYGVYYTGDEDTDAVYTVDQITRPARLTSRIYSLDGGVSHVDFDVPPGATVKVYVRGENGSGDDLTPGPAIHAQTVMDSYGLEDPETQYLSFITARIAGEENL